MNTYKVTSLSQYLETVLGIIKKDKNNIFYRGQCNPYDPLPSVFRANYMDKEKYLYHELILRCPDTFRGLSHLDTLVMMQHYELPTRLLDITSNPLVALYFACKDYKGKYVGKPGHLYIYSVPDELTFYSDSARVLMLSCLPVFSDTDKQKILKIAQEDTEDGLVRTLTNKNKYPAPIERLYIEASREVPAFQREIVAKDLITPVVVKPLKANARIVKQDGAFIISGLSNDKEEAAKSIRNMCSTVIEIADRDIMLAELDTVGINEASLFPEGDKVAGYLKDKC